MAASTPAHLERRRAVARRARRRNVLVAGLGLLALVVVAVGLVFAGSPEELPAGTQIAGVDVGGLRVADAVALLERRAAAVAATPIVFHAAGRDFPLTARALGVGADWQAAVAAAAAKGDGFGPLRGFRRLFLRLSPLHVDPAPHASSTAVSAALDRISNAIDAPHRDARLVRAGLHIETVPAKRGAVLSRAAAGPAIVAALATLDRGAVTLPVRGDAPAVSAASLRGLQFVANRILSAPVTLTVDGSRLRVPRWQLAPMLELPAAPGGDVRLGGHAADTWFAGLQRQVDRAPKDAGWNVSGATVTLVPGADGLVLDVPRTAARLLVAAHRAARRVAAVAVHRQAPKRTIAQARAMGIVGAVATYETIYGGEPNRIHNVQLVAHLIDNKLIKPGETFSFNGATGDRSAGKGFLQAPVIINGEVKTGLGGGVCQVSTTVFNAAYEAGLPIVSRTNHALYISHYPLGRDATVNYPDVDLKFTNDTGHFLLLRTFVGSSSLVVGLYGTPQHRRVESTTAPLSVVAPPKVQRVEDLTLKPGTTAVRDPGVPATTTSVERKVYDASGTLLSDQSFASSYVSSPKIVAFAPKKKPKAPATTTTSAATTTATTTSPLGATPGHG